MRGYLTKVHHDAAASGRRYFFIKSGQLVYTRSEKSSTVINALNITSLVACSGDHDDPRVVRLLVRGSEIPLLLCADTKNDARKWVNELKALIRGVKKGHNAEVKDSSNGGGEADAPSEPAMCGYLGKGDETGSSFDQRWFWLHDQFLAYSMDEKMEPVLNALSLVWTCME